MKHFTLNAIPLSLAALTPGGTMNHWMWPVSLVGILSTAVVCGTDIILFDCRPSRSQIGFIVGRNRSYGFSPHVRRRADADLGGRGDLVQLLAGRLKQE